MKKATLLSLLCLSLMPLVFSNCARNPICPGNLLPIVDIQINNTASNHDDYGTTSAYTICQARLTNATGFNNAKNFPGGVAVELRNPAASSNLVFSASGSGAGAASIFVTLPDNGGWFTFYVKGTVTNAVDKTTSVEMATAGASCAEVVLARKAMMIPSGAAPIPAAPARPRVEIEVGSVATLDDYIAWAPVFSRIRWASGSSGSTLNVTLQNMSGTDRLRFANSSLAGGATATNAILPLTLTGDGAWVNFYVAGNFSSPSVNDKDAVMEVVDASSSLLLSREGLMVRIRKNANTLTVAERDRYLEALKKMDLTYTDYIDFVKTHSRDSTGPAGSLVSHRQAHSGSAFLPWHRAFVLHLERRLQAADPSVAVPYWKFDVNAPNMFTQDFMGSNSAGNMATLAAGNPIVSWTLQGEGVPTGIQRKTPYGDGGHPTVATETATLGLGSPTFTYASFKTMEVSEHNPAHSTSGFTSSSGAPLPGASWIGGSPAIAPRDPLFFSLHCNVDRLWAKWQWLRTRYTVTDVNAYDLQGSHAAPAAGVAAPAFTQNVNGQITANRTLGQYASDTMWPWDNVLNGSGTAARPNISVLNPFPITLGGLFPFATPTVAGLIDYLTITATSPNSGLGFGYDDFFPY
jgi:tyrosinase